MGWLVVDLLALPLDPAKFLLVRSTSCSQPLSISQAMSIELRVVPLEGSVIPSLFIQISGAIATVS
jgi:hypothetical protein